MRKSVFTTILIALSVLLLCIPFLSCAPAEKNYELTRLTISQPLDHANPEGRHCPDLSNVEIGKQVLAEMLKYAK